MKFPRFALPLFLLMPSCLSAADLVMLPWQGRVTNNGTAVTGTHQFNFTLIDAAGGTIWNSGALTLPTTPNGHASALLGAVGMPAIPLSATTIPGLLLSLTVDGVPIGPATPVPTSFRAWSVADGRVNTATLANGAVTTAKLAAGAVDLTASVSGVLPPVNGGTGSSTAPAAGQLAVGNAGGTAYAPVSVSGDATLASTGALTIAASAITSGKIAPSSVDLTTKVTGTLPPANGGTGSATVPSAGQLAVGNAGGTAYAPVTISGDATLNSSGVLTLSASAITSGKIAPSSVDLTTKVTGTLPPANGGTGSATVPSAGQLAVGNAGGTAYAPVAVSGDATLASTGALTIAANAITSGKIATSAVDLTTKVTGTLPPANGGTGSTTVPSAGQLPVGNAGNTAYAPVTVSGDATLASTGALTIAANAITSGKIATNAVDLTTKVTGVLPAANGGTGINNGANTLTLGGVTSITGGGTIALGASTLTVPATGTVSLLGVAQTVTAAKIHSTNGASLTPSISLTGTWFTGGGTTNTKPQMLVEPTGATSTAWSNNGTGLGINAASGFTGNLFDAQLNGVSKFSVSSAGVVSGNGSSLTALSASNVSSGTLSPTYGGTGSAATPSAGQLPVGNAGNTAYAPVTVSGDATLASTGALTIAANAITSGKIATNAVDLTTKVTGVLPAANGGTGINNGANTLTLGGVTSITGGGTIALGASTLTVPATGTASLLGVAQTVTAAKIHSTNGASLTPSISLTGTWFTGGGTTNTKPQLLIEPTGATSTAWSNNGTGIGINAANLFAGNLIDAQVNGVSKFSVSSAGVVSGNGSSLTALSASNVSSGTLSATYGGTGVNNGANTLTVLATGTASLLDVAQTVSAAKIHSTNGAASTPALKMTGTWFTGGDATTTKPQLLVEPTGTTSTAWPTSGTGIGVNAASGFTGNLIDAQLNGVSKFSVSSAGSATIGGAMTVSVRSVASTSALFPTDYVVVFTGATGQTLTLPAPTTGRVLIIKNRSGNTVSVLPAASNSIDGVANPTTKSVTNGQCLTLVANGTDWCVVSLI